VMDVYKLEQLTEARKKTWQALQQAIGADHAAREFSMRCREAMDAACVADETARSALYQFVRAQTEDEKPEVGE
jgi:hypothetical protein